MRLIPRKYIGGSRRAGFALVEIVAVLAILLVLAALLFPALSRARQSGWRIRCLSNLRQLGMAAHLYWDDNENRAFRYRGAATNGGDIYWFGWIERGSEGSRRFDLSRGALHPYLPAAGVELCPAFAYHADNVKLKATGAAWGYGYNLCLSAPAGEPALPVNLIARSESTALFGDTAQVNSFQLPATIDHPMLEEFFYMSTNEPTVHFRHRARANILFCDGHVDAQNPIEGSLDRRLRGEIIGRISPEQLKIR